MYIEIHFLHQLREFATKSRSCISKMNIKINNLQRANQNLLSGIDKKSISSYNLSIPFSVIELTSSFFLTLLIIWLEFVLDLGFLWKFHLNCFGLSVELSTLKRKYILKINYPWILINFIQRVILLVSINIYNKR